MTGTETNSPDACQTFMVVAPATVGGCVPEANKRLFVKMLKIHASD